MALSCVENARRQAEALAPQSSEAYLLSNVVETALAKALVLAAESRRWDVVLGGLGRALCVPWQPSNIFGHFTRFHRLVERTPTLACARGRGGMLQRDNWQRTIVVAIR